MTSDKDNAPSPTPPRPEAGQLLIRALRLRCPRCGRGRLYRKWFAMHGHCAVCGLKFEPAPGYYLGATYINYGLTAVLLILSYLVLHNVLGVSNDDLLAPLMMFCVLMPLAAFRHARALWLALDCLFDRSVLSDEPE